MKRLRIDYETESDLTFKALSGNVDFLRYSNGDLAISCSDNGNLIEFELRKEEKEYLIKWLRQ